MRVGARIMLAHHPGLQKPWTPPLQPCKSHAAATARIRLCWTSWPCPWPRRYRGMLWCPSHPDPTMHRSAEQKRWNVCLVSVSTSEFRSAHQAARLKLDRLVLCHSPYACTMVCRPVPLGWWTLARPSSTGRLSPWLSVCTALSLGSSFLLAATTHKKWGVLIEKSFSESYTSEYHQTR